MYYATIIQIRKDIIESLKVYTPEKIKYDLFLFSHIRIFASEMDKSLYIISGCNGAGINNLFRLFMKEVDFWVIYDNSDYPAVQVATGGKNDQTTISLESTYKIIADYVKV